MISRVCTLALVALLLGSCPRPTATLRGGTPDPDGPTDLHGKTTPLRFGAVGPNLKLRPTARPTTHDRVVLRAARNEFAAFQVVLHAPSRELGPLTVRLSRALAGPGGAQIPRANVVLYRVEYYRLETPSAASDTRGRWPDPLIPDVDSYVGERRRAFPLTVPAGENRLVWVDILVPKDARPGRYDGALSIALADAVVGELPIELSVGRFVLPSTASLRSGFGMEFDQPCKAHTGQPSCGREWDETRANRLRARYLRAALEHRITIDDPFFQPPFDESAGEFERAAYPLVRGTDRTLRLAGAAATSLRMPADDPRKMRAWLGYLERRGLASSTFYLAGNEPTDDEWQRVQRVAREIGRISPGTPVMLSADLDATRKAGVADLIDILAPSLTTLGKQGALAAHQAWRARRPGRQLWTYLSCRTHGCDRCGVPRPQITRAAAWPNRLIDGSAVQNRALPWIAFLDRIEGELYEDVTRRLSTAWEPDGLCVDSGAGEGTLFYPGEPARIGGRTPIPIESIRLKLMREGLEDYEYLVLAAKLAPERARAIARSLFARSNDCDQPAAALERARDELFALLDR